MDVPASKVCTKCHTEKRIEEFHRDRRAKDGRESRCASCKIALTRAWCQKHTEYRRVRDRTYHLRNKERRNASCRSWYAKNREYAVAKSRSYRITHRSKFLESLRKYHEAHKVELKAYHKHYRDTHAEEIHQGLRRYREQHKDLLRKSKATYHQRVRHTDRYLQQKRDREHRRRALLRNAPVIEKIDRLAIYERDGGKCHICHRVVSRRTFSIDHLIPLVSGGSHSYINVALAHISCNKRRGPGRLPAQLRLIN